MMSSMRRLALLTILVAAPGGSALAQSPDPLAPRYAPAYTAASASAPSSTQVEINYAIADWRRLRASDGYAFADYARFLNTNPDWPDDNRLRNVAEKQMRPGEYGPTVLAFFRTESRAPAMAGRGWPKRSPPPVARPKRPPWRARPGPRATCRPPTRPTIGPRYWASLTAADHDKRADALLFARKADEAERAAAYGTPPAAPPSPRGSRCSAARPTPTRSTGWSMPRRRAMPGCWSTGSASSSSTIMKRARAASPPGRRISSIARPIPRASSRRCWPRHRRLQRAPVSAGL